MPHFPILMEWHILRLFILEVATESVKKYNYGFIKMKQGKYYYL